MLIAAGAGLAVLIFGVVAMVTDPKAFQDQPSAGSSTAPASPPAASPSPSPVTSRSDAQLLAGYDSDTHPVSDYQRLLDRLRPYCTEPIHDVAAEAWAAQQDLARNGVTASNLEVLRDLVGAASAGPRQDCRGLLAAYLVLREKG